MVFRTMAECGRGTGICVPLPSYWVQVSQGLYTFPHRAVSFHARIPRLVGFHPQTLNPGAAYPTATSSPRASSAPSPRRFLTPSVCKFTGGPFACSLEKNSRTHRWPFHRGLALKTPPRHRGYPHRHAHHLVNIDTTRPAGRGISPPKECLPAEGPLRRIERIVTTLFDPEDALSRLFGFFSNRAAYDARYCSMGSYEEGDHPYIHLAVRESG